MTWSKNTATFVYLLPICESINTRIAQMRTNRELWVEQWIETENPETVLNSSVTREPSGQRSGQSAGMIDNGHPSLYKY